MLGTKGPACQQAHRAEKGRVCQEGAAAAKKIAEPTAEHRTAHHNRGRWASERWSRPVQFAPLLALDQ